ncbi:helix-hairpin-helix domain-containing protein [Bergeyella sp. RCAD1439]|uniref:helix-hairpin-helix domain-containing protein n=1 Tax=Bergeyella anatis TaxID=3113737 RepID=UPI002E184C0F|nr:helix-hairpin-helix domain-containing protein [Bergeyella sp. RCAD1439]
MKAQLPNQLRRKQLSVLTIIALVALAVQWLPSFLSPTELAQEPVEFISTLEDSAPDFISEFDPNDLSESQWRQLGFSEKQVATILKYKKSLGGSFSSKAQLKQCYALSAEKYKMLEPYILLPEFHSSNAPSEKFFRSSGLKLNAPFDPNRLSKAEWITMGFSEKQAETILKYKKSLGGRFENEEQIKSCFVVSEDYFAQMKPFLRFSSLSDGTSAKEVARPLPSRKPRVASFFDPNALDQKGWIELGFSESQAKVILNYKAKILKGRFSSAEDLRNCFVVSAETFDELKPWIKIPSVQDGGGSVSGAVQKNATDFSKVDLNQITYAQLVEFGFGSKEAGSLVNYRKRLGGFVNKNQIFETYGIDRALAEQLVKTALLDESSVTKYRLNEAPESWLKTHPYFRYSADKIIFYRITHPDDKKIWKYLNAKPEYEVKMKWYLKE